MLRKGSRLVSRNVRSQNVTRSRAGRDGMGRVKATRGSDECLIHLRYIPNQVYLSMVS